MKEGLNSVLSLRAPKVFMSSTFHSFSELIPHTPLNEALWFLISFAFSKDDQKMCWLPWSTQSLVNVIKIPNDYLKENWLLVARFFIFQICSWVMEIITHTMLMIYPCNSEQNQWEIWCSATLILDPVVLNKQNMTNQSHRPPDTTQQ